MSEGSGVTTAKVIKEGILHLSMGWPLVKDVLQLSSSVSRCIRPFIRSSLTSPFLYISIPFSCAVVGLALERRGTLAVGSSLGLGVSARDCVADGSGSVAISRYFNYRTRVPCRKKRIHLKNHHLRYLLELAVAQSLRTVLQH